MGKGGFNHKYAISQVSTEAISYLHPRQVKNYMHKFLVFSSFLSRLQDWSMEPNTYMWWLILTHQNEISSWRNYSPLKQFFIVWSPKFLQPISYRLFKCTTHRTNAQSPIHNLKPNCHGYIIVHEIVNKLLIALQFRRRELPIFIRKMSLYVIIISINTCNTQHKFPNTMKVRIVPWSLFHIHFKTNIFLFFPFSPNPDQSPSNLVKLSYKKKCRYCIWKGF